MKRGSLFFIGLLSAIITIVSLNFAFGNRFSRYPNYRHYHECDKRNYDSRYKKEDDHFNQKNHSNADGDSLNSNY